ncbi:MAG: hypothetical protein JWO62_2112 [Acidimicrobiaceae bacterium]|nr:hypothetical protein [Acidimicrobiaceae bacterium]
MLEPRECVIRRLATSVFIKPVGVRGDILFGVSHRSTLLGLLGFVVTGANPASGLRLAIAAQPER